jgi:nitrogen fixation NifU-like protein
MSNQLDLYQQVILEHNRKPRNFRKLDNATCRSEGLNPLCGDHLEIFVKLDAEQKIEEVTFQGSGCAISRASASMMTESLKGKPLEECKDIFAAFQKLLHGELDPEKDAETLGKLKIFKGVWQYPSRVKCASLAWHAFKGAVDQEKIVTTES